MLIKWLRRLLGIRSPSEDFMNVYGPIALAEMGIMIAYTKLVLDYLQERITNDAKQ